MRAIVYERYGPPEVLRVAEVQKPVPEDDEVLVKVHATTVNRTDVGLRSGKPFISKFFTGLRQPRNQILGMVTVERAEKGLFGTAYRIPSETSHASQPRSPSTSKRQMRRMRQHR